MIKDVYFFLKSVPASGIHSCLLIQVGIFTHTLIWKVSQVPTYPAVVPYVSIKVLLHFTTLGIQLLKKKKNRLLESKR